LLTTILSYPSSIVIVNPPSFDFTEISKVSVILPVFLIIKTKSVAYPGAVLWLSVRSLVSNPYDALGTSSTLIV
jgi:hypothetical protein